MTRSVCSGAGRDGGAAEGDTTGYGGMARYQEITAESHIKFAFVPPSAM